MSSPSNTPYHRGDNYHAPINGANVGGVNNRNLVNNNDGQEDWESKLVIVQQSLPYMKEEEKILQAQLTVAQAVKYVKKLQAIINDVQPKLKALAENPRRK